MSRQRTKGTTFETQLVDWLNERFHGERTFHRLGMGGANDMGDVWGLFAHGKRVVIECKNHLKMALSEWLDEAERERTNAGALASVVVHKRKGRGAKRFGENYVTLTLEDFAAIVTGEREE